MPTNGRYQSWSRLPLGESAVAITPRSRDARIALDEGHNVLPFGRGRTYGDTCVNPSGAVLDTRRLDRILEFDEERGRLRCESGATLAQILELVVPRGWFLPVCPGTRHVSVGGAIAHDVHGKNQARRGTFGCYVEELELLRSAEGRVRCTMDENAELFAATIGGLGLTGLILSAELRLRRITGPILAVEKLRCDGLDAFFEHARSVDAFEYGLAWVDSFAGGVPGRRSLILRGNHVDDERDRSARAPRRPSLPHSAPAALFNRTTLRLFNLGYYYGAHFRRRVAARRHYEPFLFPQDTMHPSNRLYGRRGVYAYHALLPRESAEESVPRFLERLGRPGEQSLVTVLKVFGDRCSPGMLSFSGPGVSIACGFPNEGARTLGSMDGLDRIVADVGGKLYPAKDARMSASMFRSSYPRWEEFSRHVDPRFSSSFWRRVTEAPPA